jgi:GxxExxY protein
VRKEGAKDAKGAKEMDENEISMVIVNAALKIHKSLGPGLLESAYKECLYYELLNLGLFVEKEKILPLVYEEVRLECGYRADIILENKVIFEIKAVEALNDVYFAQTLTYLKLSKCKLGLLINFNVSFIRDGIRRIVNNL